MAIEESARSSKGRIIGRFQAPRNARTRWCHSVLTPTAASSDTCDVPVTTAVASKTVIVADDTAFVRDRFRSALQSAGHRASIVSDAPSLLARVREDSSKVDLVVTDLRLPTMQGTALVRALRGIAGFQAPIVVFSGTIANADEVRELSLLGVAGYINEYSAVQHNVPALSPHLFPDQYRLRTSPRMLAVLSVH